METQLTGKTDSGESIRILTKKQMAAEFGVTCRTIERWYSTGYIRRIRIGGRIYFSYSEVVRIRDRFLEDGGRFAEPAIRCAGDIVERYNDRIGQRL